MALTTSQLQTLGSQAPDFALRGVHVLRTGETQERLFTLADFSEARALVVVFICNHCPYVIAIQDRIASLAREYQPRGVAFVAINPNDPARYPEDSFEGMKQRAREVGYTFPYLQDETQSVARAYGAVCTPDPYVFARESGEWRLRYQGRWDDSWKDPVRVQRRELAEALDVILAAKSGDLVEISNQVPSMGCSIKWRT